MNEPTQVSDGIKLYSPNIKVYELMGIPKIEERISGFMMLCRDEITLPGVRRRAVKNIAYAEANLIAKSLPRVRWGPKKIQTGNKLAFSGYAGVRYIPDMASIPVPRAGVEMYKGAEKRFDELGITPYNGMITAKRVETDDAVRDNFRAKIIEGDYVRIPSVEEMPGMYLSVWDPMLATASTSNFIIGKIEERSGEGLPRKLYMGHILASDIGVNHLVERLIKSPLREIETEIFVGQIDRGGIDKTGLDNHNFIAPGGGDMGDLLASSDPQHAKSHGMTLTEFMVKYPLGVSRDLEPVLPFLRHL